MGPNVASFVVNLKQRLQGKSVRIIAYSIASFDVAVVALPLLSLLDRANVGGLRDIIFLS